MDLHAEETTSLAKEQQKIDEEFYNACRDGKLETAREFLKEADPNWKDYWNGWTGLIGAARNGHTEVVKFLVKETNAEVNATTKNGYTALMHAAGNGHADIVKYLVEEGSASINATNKSSSTACYLAARNGHLEVVKLLASFGADRQLRNEEGRTPLDIAEQRGHRPVVDYLVELEAATTSYTELVQRAMREGVTKLLIIKALIIGPPGVGKTGIRHLLLGLPPPPSRTSTLLLTRATRALSFFRIKADGRTTEDVTWMELDDSTHLKFIAEEVKMLKLNPSRAAPPQLNFTLEDTESGASKQEKASFTNDGLLGPSVSPFTCSLPANSSTKKKDVKAKPRSRTTLKMDGTVFNIAHQIFSDPELSEESNTKKTFIHLIDSGGQPSFISLIPAFVRGCTVNIVASKLNRSIKDKLHYEYVKDDKHLRQPTKLKKSQLEGIEEIIRTLSSVKHTKKAGNTELEPKFLLVGTHADRHWTLFDETLSGKNRWLKKSLGELKSTCIEINARGDILQPVNTRVKKGRGKVASSLRQKIIDSCSDAEVDIPTRWYVFELEVSGKAKKKGRSVLGLAECMEIGENLTMDAEEVKAALRFLDSAALCLYFQAAAPHLVFTDSQAILSEITEILILGIIDLVRITSEYPCLTTKHMALVRQLRDKGLFSRELVDVVCSKYRVNEEKCSYSLDNFLSILQHLLIIAPVSIKGENLFFLPSILPTSRKIAPLSGELTPLLILCSTRVIPLGMFSGLVVALCRNNELFVLKNINGCNEVSFEYKLGGVVLLVEYHAWLAVHFNGCPSAAPKVRDTIYCALDSFCTQRHLDTKQIEFTDGFLCPYRTCESIPHPCKMCSTTRWLTCSAKPDIYSWLCKEENMLAWFKASDDAAKSPSTLSSGGSDAISQFQFMESVASKIPAKWRKMGVALDIDTAVLDGFDKHRRGDNLDCFSDVFTYWQQHSTPESPANWSTLAAKLRSNYVGEQRLSESIEKDHMELSTNYKTTAC